MQNFPTFSEMLKLSAHIKSREEIAKWVIKNANRSIPFVGKSISTIQAGSIQEAAQRFINVKSGIALLMAGCFMLWVTNFNDHLISL